MTNTRESKGLKLLGPFSLGCMDLKNRIVLAPMVTNYPTEDGYVTAQAKAYYEERAKGGVGLIIIEGTPVDLTRGRIIRRHFAVEDDKFIPGLKELVQVIHKYGAKVALQLEHGGKASRRDLISLPGVTASKPAIPDSPYSELAISEIPSIVMLFAKAADRAKKAGFDGVEIHAAHGYLLAEFLSPMNKRQDAYGGELRNRARILLEVIAAVREKVGVAYPIWCRINAEQKSVREGGPTFEGTTIEDARELAQILRDSGIDAISVSGQPAVRSYYTYGGYNVRGAEVIRRASGLPVIVAGGIDVEIGERILEEQRADLIAMGRALIADPELPNKLASGRADEIRPCQGCVNCESDVDPYGDRELRCVVNPRVGKEREYVVKPAEKAKKVVVVGGGPGGMEAAVVAAERGHSVTLYEKNSELGGQLVLAAIPPNKSRILKLKRYFVTCMAKAGVKVELAKEVDVTLIQKISPDVVVLATGSSLLAPNITGINTANVVTFEDVLIGRTRIGKKVIVIGGGKVGCETADFLARRGKKVIIVEMLDVIMKEATKEIELPTIRTADAVTKEMVSSSRIRSALLDVLTTEGVNMMTETKAVEITKGGLIVATREGVRQTIDADTIVLATGAKPNVELIQALEGKVPDVYCVGDCVKPRTILEAIHEGFGTALTI